MKSHWGPTAWLRLTDKYSNAQKQTDSLKHCSYVHFLFNNYSGYYRAKNKLHIIILFQYKKWQFLGLTYNIKNLKLKYGYRIIYLR